MERYDNHLDSLSLAKKQRTIIVEKACFLEKNGVEISMEFLTAAVQLIVECRRLLAWSYACAFFIKKDLVRERFQFQQNYLEETTEKLHGLVEDIVKKNVDKNTPISATQKASVFNLTNALAKYKVSMEVPEEEEEEEEVEVVVEGEKEGGLGAAGEQKKAAAPKVAKPPAPPTPLAAVALDAANKVRDLIVESKSGKVAASEIGKLLQVKEAAKANGLKISTWIKNSEECKALGILWGEEYLLNGKSKAGSQYVTLGAGGGGGGVGKGGGKGGGGESKKVDEEPADLEL